jgi:hypothetical protein
MTALPPIRRQGYGPGWSTVLERFRAEADSEHDPV